MRARVPRAGGAGGVLVLLAQLSLACGDSSNPAATPTTPSPPAATTPTPAAPSSYAFLEGDWTGEWVDTRFGVRGSLRASFTVDGNVVTATGVIGLQSLGLGDEPGTGAGTIDGERLSFTFEAQTVGNGEGDVEGGSGSGRGTVLGVLDFGDFTFEGTAGGTTIDGTFQFTDPSGGRGTARLTKS